MNILIIALLKKKSEFTSYSITIFLHVRKKERKFLIKISKNSKSKLILNISYLENIWQSNIRIVAVLQKDILDLSTYNITFL